MLNIPLKELRIIQNVVRKKDHKWTKIATKRDCVFLTNRIFKSKYNRKMFSFTVKIEKNMNFLSR